MKGKDLIKQLVKAGWEIDRITGSHHILRKGDELISVPVHGSKDIKPGTLNKLLKQGGLK
ncbi:MAG: type II toxin-antitoxin system HicA family toxin [Nitrospirae bacterium]|uniref:type II toxin-antitoxin system HicA family toxin n=1 Tax=Candidatus Magnetobacterium casense TaxID=1455061 RepID=UPI00058D75C2|nr:type II toxin-antitoxin system HicA family toxin [Candidatus Magnetobacterium casensis]MBF0337516.1 type II toxin-antitoxin system HicA family toxin [Nitrospirota bacterium]